MGQEKKKKIGFESVSRAAQFSGPMWGSNVMWRFVLYMHQRFVFLFFSSSAVDATITSLTDLGYIATANSRRLENPVAIITMLLSSSTDRERNICVYSLYYVSQILAKSIHFRESGFSAIYLPVRLYITRLIYYCRCVFEGGELALMRLTAKLISRPVSLAKTFEGATWITAHLRE